MSQLTAKEWFSLVKDDKIRGELLECLGIPEVVYGTNVSKLYDNIQNAIANSMWWDATPKGYDYMSNLHRNPPELHPIPNPDRLRDEETIRNFWRQIKDTNSWNTEITDIAT